MIVKATERSVYLDVSAIERAPIPYPGVETKVLYAEPSGRQTAVRMAPGAKLPDHCHVGWSRASSSRGP